MSDTFVVVCFMVGDKERLCSGKVDPEKTLIDRVIYVQSLDNPKIATEISAKHVVFVQIYSDMTVEEFKTTLNEQKFAEQRELHEFKKRLKNKEKEKLNDA